MTPNTLLFAGEVFDGRDETHPKTKLRDGSTIEVRVRLIPARHLTEDRVGYLDLYEAGNEAARLELCVQRKSKEGAWVLVDAAFVDSLDDASHVFLLEVADRLNFDRAVSQAERQIATRRALVPLKTKLAEQITAPMKAVLDSWTSSLTTQISAALAGKKP